MCCFYQKFNCEPWFQIVRASKTETYWLFEIIYPKIPLTLTLYWIYQKFDPGSPALNATLKIKKYIIPKHQNIPYLRFQKPTSNSKQFRSPNSTNPLMRTTVTPNPEHPQTFPKRFNRGSLNPFAPYFPLLYPNLSPLNWVKIGTSPQKEIWCFLVFWTEEMVFRAKH